MLTDIEIAQQCAMKPITEIASELNIRPEELEPYGHYKAKLSDSLFDRLADRPSQTPHLTLSPSRITAAG